MRGINAGGVVGPAVRSQGVVCSLGHLEECEAEGEVVSERQALGDAPVEAGHVHRRTLVFSRD